MVGFCGVVGEFDRGLDTVTDTVVWSESEHDSRYVEDGIDIYVSLHRSTETTSQPATTTDGRSVWVWGDVIGYENSTGYESQPFDGETDAEYCLRLLDSHGMEFVDGLNSEFAGVVIDDESDDITLFTDRLGARPIYYTAAIDDVFFFSTHPRTILAHPDIEPTLDEELLIEYLALERVCGTMTPFEELVQLHPGSRLEYDPREDAVTRTTYWVPTYDPVDKPYDELVSEFTSLFRKSAEDRKRSTEKTGLLVSGGSDSRLLLSTLGSGVTGFHMNEGINSEARTAKRACNTVGAEFRFLQRDKSYQTEVLSTVSDFLLFTSFFDQAHAVGFDEILRDEVDSVFSGQYSDTLLSGLYDPTKILRLPGLGWQIPLPAPGEIASADDYVEYMLEDHSYTRDDHPETISYLKKAYDVRSIVLNRLERRGNEIYHHGVTYPSLDDLTRSGGFYPLTNARGYLFYYTLNQIVPAHCPYLDNRIIDFALSMPYRFQFRRNVVNRSLRMESPTLSKIPHADTGLSLTYPELVHETATLFSDFLDKIGVSSRDDGGSWSDHDRVIRESEIVPRHLLDRDSNGCWEEIDFRKVQNLCEKHLDGESHYVDLYALLSLCNTYPFSSNSVSSS